MVEGRDVSSNLLFGFKGGRGLIVRQTKSDYFFLFLKFLKQTEEVHRFNGPDGGLRLTDKPDSLSEGSCPGRAVSCRNDGLQYNVELFPVLYHVITSSLSSS